MFPIHYRFCFAGLVALLSGGGAAVGQSFDAYQLLRCHAPIPEEFTTSSTEKVLRDDARVTGSDNDRKAKKEFFLENNFVIDDLLQSGRVLFNDSVSAYVNKVADRLLAKKPELRKQLRFYAVKYPSVNAFATDRGTVFVNVGLVAHLQNEAQLAFVLAHEIIHFQKRHAVNAYVRFKRIEADGRGFRSDYYKSLLERSQYSQAIETEADREGMELFASSGYAPQAGIDAFDMMARAHLPYEDRPFDKAFLETPLLKIPKKLLLTETQAIKEDRDADTLSTHPATKIRKALAVKRLGKESGAGKVLYLVSEAEFTKVRDLARFETLNAYLHSRDYEAALYHTYLLSCDYPHSQYLTAARARALYGLAQYVANDRREEVLEDYTELQGQQQQLYAILYKLSKAELATLAARACWDAYRAYPKDDAAWQMCKDMVEDIPIFILDKPEEYYRKNVQDTAGVHAGSFARTAFIDIWTNKEFQGMLASGAKFKKQLNELTNATSKGKHSHHRSSSANSEYSEGTALGIRSALVINPTYMAADYRHRRPMKYIESEKRQTDFKRILQTEALALRFQTKVLDVKALTPKTSIAEYNDLLTVDSWADECVAHNMDFVPCDFNAMQAIARKYKTENVMYSGVVSVRAPNRTIFAFLAPLVLYPLIPSFIADVLTPKRESMYFTSVLDIATSRRVSNYVNTMPIGETDDVIRTNLLLSLGKVMQKKPTKSK